VKFTAAVSVPLHIVWFPGLFTTGVGSTVIVNTLVGPVQLARFTYLGVTVIVAVTGAAVALAPAKDPMLNPVPLAANPIEGVSFTQS
jgi:hypothetical protein